jgi:nucleoside phosphorylase
VRVVGQPVELAQHRISIGYDKGEKLYIVRTGAGNLNSAMVTQALLTRYRIDRVISIGVAGYIGEEGASTTEIPRQARDDNAAARPKAYSKPLRADSFHIGDLFIATEVVNHQEGKETPSGFEVKEGQPSAISHQLSAGYKQKCAELRSNAVEIARSALTNEIPRQARNDTHAVHQGRLVSGDSFIASTAKRKWLRETFHADAVDMVSAGIARVCEANGVPYVIIRVLSDNADESASATFANFVQSNKGPVTVPVVLKVIEQVAVPRP